MERPLLVQPLLLVGMVGVAVMVVVVVMEVVLMVVLSSSPSVAPLVSCPNSQGHLLTVPQGEGECRVL
jgi:hypothetical protein